MKRLVHASKRNSSIKVSFALIQKPIFNGMEVNWTQVIHNSDIWWRKPLALSHLHHSHHANHTSPQKTIIIPVLILRPTLRLISRMSGIVCGPSHRSVIRSRPIRITGATNPLLIPTRHLSLDRVWTRFIPTMSIRHAEETLPRWWMSHPPGAVTAAPRCRLLLPCHLTLRERYEWTRTVNYETFSRISPTVMFHLHCVPISQEEKQRDLSSVFYLHAVFLE